MTTTVTEERIIRTVEDADQPPPKPPKAVTLQPPALPEGRSSLYSSSQSVENMKNDLNATVIPKFNVNGTTAQAITGILKGGKFRKTDSIQVILLNIPLIDDIQGYFFVTLKKQFLRDIKFNSKVLSSMTHTGNNPICFISSLSLCPLTYSLAE